MFFFTQISEIIQSIGQKRCLEFRYDNRLQAFLSYTLSYHQFYNGNREEKRDTGSCDRKTQPSDGWNRWHVSCFFRIKMKGTVWGFLRQCIKLGISGKCFDTSWGGKNLLKIYEFRMQPLKTPMIFTALKCS